MRNNICRFDTAFADATRRRIACLARAALKWASRCTTGEITRIADAYRPRGGIDKPCGSVWPAQA